MMEGRSFVQENHWSLSEKKKEGNMHFVLHSSDLHFLFISSCDCNYLMAMWLLSASTVTELQAEAWKMNLRVASMKKKKRNKDERLQQTTKTRSSCSLSASLTCQVNTTAGAAVRQRLKGDAIALPWNNKSFHFSMMSASATVSMKCSASPRWLRTALSHSQTCSSSHVISERSLRTWVSLFASHWAQLPIVLAGPVPVVIEYKDPEM